MITKNIQLNNVFDAQFPAQVITRQQIKYIRSLHQKKFRDEYNCYIAEGQKIINEVIADQTSGIELLVYTPKAEHQLYLDRLQSSVKCLAVSSKEFSRISLQKTPQEALAVISKKNPSNAPVTPDDSLVLALDRIQDPGNVGTILRLADWFGINHVLCSDDCVDRYNPKVIQASMGAFLRVSMHYGRLDEMLMHLKEQQNYRLYGTSLDGSNIHKENFPEKSVIVLGNESGGISKPVFSVTDRQISVPNYSPRKDKTESLNVALAAAIVCAEIRRKA